MDNLIGTAETGRIRREGFNVVIVGKPNVGKSTLFNALLRADRAIVTPYPGTTRDSLEDRALFGGLAFVFIDTAGIRDHPEPVEEEGIRRTRAVIEQADLVLTVVDGSRPLDHQDQEIVNSVGDRSSVVVMNKADLGLNIGETDRALAPQAAPRVAVSAMTGQGLERLEELLIELGRNMASVTDKRISTGLNRRCATLMQNAREPVSTLLDGFEMDGAIDLQAASIELRKALDPLEEITGERVDEGIMERIFERFCVGK
jgi:tRNA modification GTPase